MKHLRILAGVVLFLLGPVAVLMAQPHQVGETDVSAFPAIKVKLADRDPVPKSAEYFRVMSGDTALSFEVTNEVGEKADQPKTILILWELLSYTERKAQNAYFREYLTEALSGILQPGDQVNVATFAWTDLDESGRTLNFLGPDFTGEVDGLLEAVAEAKPPGGKGVQTNHGSELFPAIEEGLKALSGIRDRARIMVVLSAEFANIYNPAQGEASVIGQAREADIAIYNHRFKVKDAKYNIDDVATKTFGLSAQVDPEDASASAAELLEQMEGAGERAAGRLYNFDIEADHAVDGALHQFQIVAGNEPVTISYTTEAPGFVQNLLDKPILLGGIALGLVLIVVLLILLARRNKRRREAAEMARKQEVDSLARRGEEAEEHLAELTEMQKKEEERRARIEAEADKKKRDKEARQEAERLRKEMYAGGKSPRLALETSDGLHNLELPGPVVILGRASDADITVNQKTVSRNHAQIIYVEGIYTLTDLGSTNGTFHNGERVDSATLRHGDAVGLGDAKLIFYI